MRKFEVILLQEGGPLPGPETGLLSNTRKWILWGDTCVDKAITTQSLRKKSLMWLRQSNAEKKSVPFSSFRAPVSLSTYLLVKAMFSFPVVRYGCESLTIKKAEHWRIYAFEFCCWRRLLRVSWTARRSNQSILKEISPECSLEGLMLKLKLQFFGHLMWRTDSLKRTLILGKIKGRRKRGWQDEMVGWHHWLYRHEFGQALWVGDGQGSLACCSLWSPKQSDMTEQLNWTEELTLSLS